MRHTAQYLNGACALKAVTFVADDPSLLMPRMDALGAAVVAREDGFLSAQLPGRGVVHIMRSDTLSEGSPYARGLADPEHD